MQTTIMDLFSFCYNIIKRKKELTKIQRKKVIFINRTQYSQQKIFCICIDVYKIYEGNDFNRIFEVLSEMKNKKKLKLF